MTTTNRNEINLIISEYLKKELLLNGHNWQSTNQINRNQDLIILNSNKRKSVIDSLCSLSQSIRTNYGTQIQQMCTRLDNQVDDLINLDYESFESVARELFSQGIKWGHICILLVFSLELILLKINEDPSRESIDLINQHLSTYINDNLLNWINDHNAWQGLINYSNQYNTNESTIDGIFKKINWHDNKILKFGTAISLGIGIFIGVCILISKSK